MQGAEHRVDDAAIQPRRFGGQFHGEMNDGVGLPGSLGDDRAVPQIAAHGMRAKLFKLLRRRIRTGQTGYSVPERLQFFADYPSDIPRRPGNKNMHG